MDGAPVRRTKPCQGFCFEPQQLALPFFPRTSYHLFDVQKLSWSLPVSSSCPGIFKNSMPCQSCDMENRPHTFDRQSLGKAQGQRWLFPISSRSLAGGEKVLLGQASAGQLDNNWLILYRFWTRLLQSGSRGFKTRFIKVRRPGQVKDWHLGPESITCFFDGEKLEMDT